MGLASEHPAFCWGLGLSEAVGGALAQYDWCTYKKTKRHHVTLCLMWDQGSYCYKLPFLFWVWFPHFRGFPSLWAQIKENKNTICRWLIKISQLCSMPNLKKWRLKIKFCSTFKIIYHSIEIYIFILPKEARRSVPLNFFKNSFFSPIYPTPIPCPIEVD